MLYMYVKWRKPAKSHNALEHDQTLLVSNTKLIGAFSYITICPSTRKGYLKKKHSAFITSTLSKITTASQYSNIVFVSELIESSLWLTSV